MNGMWDSILSRVMPARRRAEIQSISSEVDGFFRSSLCSRSH